MPPIRLLHPCAALAAVLLLSGQVGAAPADPLLTCEVTYAGLTHTVKARPVSDPYSVPSVDIGGRFWFKAVVVGQGRQVQRIALYAYLEGQDQPLLIQAATYLPPFGPWPGGRSLTGEQHLYAGPLERELIYNCQWLEGAP